MKRYVPCIVIILLLALSCTGSISKNESWQNEQIDPKIKAVTEQLDGQVYAYLQANNYEPLSQLFSDTMLSRVNSDFAQKFMPQIQKVIKGHNYRTGGKFYIRHIKQHDSLSVSSGAGDYACTLKFIAPERETIVSMLIAGDELNEVMITLMWSKINDKWKLSNLTGEDYSLNNKNAIQHYRHAIALAQSGDIMDAVNVMELSRHCLSAGGNIFRYNIAAQIGHYADSLGVVCRAKYAFPITVAQLPARPLIFNIHYEVMGRALVPMVMYKSAINVADTIALHAENEGLQQQIGNIFRGFDKNNITLLYRAYNEQPDGQNNPRYYGYVQHIR